jgi:peptidoglycan-associated lipoprotein
MHRLPALIGVCAVLCACNSNPEKPAEATPAPVPAVHKVEPPPVETAAQRQERAIRELAAKSLYFDSGSHAVRTEYQGLIKEISDFLRSAPTVSLTLAGNSDERGAGSRATGLKRAEAVKHALALAGVGEDRLQVISEGKDKPRATCHEEKCWSQNRRVDLVFHGAAAK